MITDTTIPYSAQKKTTLSLTDLYNDVEQLKEDVKKLCGAINHIQDFLKQVIND